MMPYIGSKISLISKSDVRYEGILVEINQENSTVSLENVHSWGTEGRKARREDEISPSEEPFPFVVFRGADVKDLHVMTAPSKAPAPNPMRVPNDPAVISSGPGHMHPHGPHGMGHGPFQGVSGPPGQMQPPGFGGFGGPPFPGQPGQPGFPGMPGGHPYGLPPPPMGFAPYPPPPFNQQKPDEQLWAPHDSNQGNSSNPAAAPGMNQYSQPPPPQRPPQQQQQQPAQGPQPQKPAEDAPKETRGKNQRDSQKPPQNVKEVTQAIERLDLNESVKVSKDSRPQGKPSTKPDSGEVRPEKRKDLTSGPTERAAPKEPAVKSPNAEVPARSTGPAGGEEQRIAADQAAKPLAKPTEAGEGSAEKEVNDVNGRDGTDSRYEARLPGTGAHLVHSGQRRGRGRGFRGSAPSSRGGRISVPDSDFDFEISNAKFNKTDVANEASANATHDVVVRTEADDDEEDGTEESEDDPSFYQKSSFFDNISCDAKDRAESHDGRGGRRVRQFEERKLNLETFGQMGVENRGGYRRGGFRRGGGRGGRGGYNSYQGEGPAGHGYHNQGGYGGRGRGGYQGSYNDGYGHGQGYGGNQNQGYGGNQGYGYGRRGGYRQQQQQQQQP